MSTDDPAHPVRESIEDALENDRCGICASVEHFREDCRYTPDPARPAGAVAGAAQTGGQESER